MVSSWVSGCGLRCESSWRRSLLDRGGFGAGCAPKVWLGLYRAQRYVGGAGAVAVDDGRQPLHVGAQDLRRWPAARPRRAPETPRPHATPGSGAGRSGCPGSGRAPGSWWSRSRPRSARRPPGRRRPRRRRRRSARPASPRPGWCRCGAGRRSGPRRRRRSRAAAAWRPRPDRRRCARAWPGRPRSAGSAWRAGRGRPAARPRRRWPRRRRPSIRASRCRRTPAAEMPSRSPISAAVIEPDSSSSCTIARRVWPSCAPGAAARHARQTSDGIFTTPV